MSFSPRVVVRAMVVVVVATVAGIIAVVVYQPDDGLMIITHIVGFGTVTTATLRTYAQSLANSEQITQVGAQLSGQDERERAREE